LTISDTRTLDDDRGGAGVQDHLEGAGHHLVERTICPDEPDQIRAHVVRWVEDPEVDVILLTGGTGISHRDQTYETVRGLLTRELPGYGELFRWLSYQEIGSAAMLSRALGGLVATTVVLTMPGSPAAVRLAMQRIILPELGHLVAQARK
jgi:molybdenum cofactor biosynthesis protein B